MVKDDLNILIEQARTNFSPQAIAIANAIPQIVWTAKPNGYVDYCNQQWFDYSGLNIEQTKDSGWFSVLHPDDVVECLNIWKNSIQTGQPYQVEFRLKRYFDQQYRWHIGRALPVKDDNGIIIKWFGVCTDIQDQKYAYDLIEKKVKERTSELDNSNLKLLKQIEERKKVFEKQQLDSVRLKEIITTQYLLAKAELDLESFLSLVVNRIDLLTPSTCSIVELKEGNEMVYRAASGVAADHLGLRLDINNSISGLCVKSQEVLSCKDTEKDDRVNKEACRLLNIRSLIVAPLFSEGKALGVLKAVASDPSAFSESDVQTLQLLAGLTGAAIEHQLAFEAKQKILNELNHALTVIKINEQRTKTIIESSYDAFISLNSEGMITDWNIQAEKTFGWTKEQAIGMFLGETIVPERFKKSGNNWMNYFKNTGKDKDININKKIEILGVRKNGEEFPLEVTISSIKNENKFEFCAFFHDITERKKAEEKLVYMAQYDQMTGLANRVLFNDRLENAMKRSARTKNLMALLYLDIDYFKKINDIYGHGVGDSLLKEFANRLQKSVRSVDTVARLGGDEFVIIMEELKEPANSNAISEKIMKNIREPVHIDTHIFNITSSIGGAFYKGENLTIEDLIVMADKALYKAKEKGKNNAFWNI